MMESRRRPTMSCENCRSRKVKVQVYTPPVWIAIVTYHQCIKPDLDACQRCQRLGKECVTTGEKYARPYYHTSKEKYELIATVIRHFVPSASLDTEGLRQIIATLNQHSQGPGPSSVGMIDDANAQNILPPRNTPPLPEVRDEDDGAMLDDAMNTLRKPFLRVKRPDLTKPGYESGSSCAVFHYKICSSTLTSHSPFSSLKKMRREGIQDGQIVELARTSDLPAKTILEAAASRFFAEVNSVIFVMSEDHFQYRLDDIYNTQQNCSNSFLAIIYLVLALGQKSETYFKAACSLFDKSVEEGSEDSVQVVMLTVWFWSSPYYGESLIVAGPLQAKPEPEKSCLGSLRDRNPNCSVSGAAFNWEVPERTLGIPGSVQKKIMVFALWTGAASRMRVG